MAAQVMDGSAVAAAMRQARRRGGRSPILGKPVGMLLLQRDATVTYCHSRTRDLATVVSTGDVVIAAMGRPALIRGEWIKPGAVVVDAGYNAGNIGDVEYEAASLITPVPGAWAR